MASQELAVIQKLDTEVFKKELARALPNTLNPDRMVRLAITMIRRNESLGKCDPVSVMACVVEASQLGLELESVLGHAYLVPYKSACTLIVGYRGFSHLMYQSGIYAEICAEVVRPGDQFKRTLGTNRGLYHIPEPIPDKDNPEQWIGAYCVTIDRGHHNSFTYLERVEIEKARARSASYRAYKEKGYSSPWVTDTAEMWKKTAIRRHAKKSQTSTTDKRDVLLRAVMLDEYAERKGLLVPTLAGFEVNPNPPKPDPDEEPLTPTREIANGSSKASKGKSASSFRESASTSKNSKPFSPNTGGNPHLPKAIIPKGEPIDVKPEPPAEGPFISQKEQSDLYNRAITFGWKIPDDVILMLKKKFKTDSVRLVRKSQLPAIYQILESGT